MIQKTFKLSHRQIMWEENWPNLILKMKDMPHYRYKPTDKKGISKKDDFEAGAVAGDIDTLKSKFSKYVKQ